MELRVIEARRERPTASIHYTLYLPDGRAVSSHNTGAPYRFPLGGGAVIPGLEQAVAAMEVGETRRIQLTPAQAFGEHDPSRVRFAHHRHVHGAGEEDLQPGRAFRVARGDGEEQAFVRETRDDGIVFDLNHPLAGVEITMDVTLLHVEFAEAAPEAPAPTPRIEVGPDRPATEYRPAAPASLMWA